VSVHAATSASDSSCLRFRAAVQISGNRFFDTQSREKFVRLPHARAFTDDFAAASVKVAETPRQRQYNYRRAPFKTGTSISTDFPQDFDGGVERNARGERFTCWIISRI
jgi:hypothetical protein